MRGTSSKAKMRLRSGGYKCNLCGRRVVDSALLERHLKNMHNIPSKGRKVVFKAKPQPQSKEDMEKAFDNLIREKIVDEIKTKTKIKKQEPNGVSVGDPLAFTAKDLKTVDPAEHNEGVVQKGNVENDVNAKNSKRTYNKRRAEFECPVCSSLFNVYYTAYKHIQKMHPINALGQKVPINSPDLIQPVRVEQCLRCFSKMKSSEPHICQNMDNPSLAQYLCALCNQGFITLRSFDLHVGGLHCGGVESMFFPTELELTNWRLQMERETNAKYVYVGSYDLKKVYRCSYTKQAPRSSNLTRSSCPSTLIIQEFTKGTQVHFYPEHCDNHAKTYPEHLSMKYVNYSISTFLKCPDDIGNMPIKKTSNKELYRQFQTLMEGIIIDAKKLDAARLNTLVEKAIDMTTVFTKEIEVAKPNKSMTDEEITEVLEHKSQKRRTSMDCLSTSPPVAAKRTRNKSMFSAEDVVSPKIVSTYSLAPDIKAGSNESISKPISPIEGLTPEIEKSKQMSTRSTRFNQSPSFNDTYKDFVDKTIKAASNITSMRPRRSGGGMKIDPPQKPPVAPEVSSAVPDNIKKIEVKTDGTTAKIEGIKKLNDVTITKVESASKPANTYKPGPKFTKTTTLTLKLEKIEPPTPLSAKKPKTAPKETPELEKVAAKKPLDFKYEVVEQENDCNILVLKF